MMGMVTYDGLYGTEQNRRVNSLKGSMSVKAKYCGSDRRWYMYIHMRSSSGLFHAHINAKSATQFPAGKRKFTPPSFGKECKRQCREDAAVKL